MKTDKSANNRAKKRKNPLLKFTLFAARPKVGKWTLYPLTGGRMAVLEERKNPLGMGVQDGDEIDSFAVYEALLVLILDGEELAELSLLDDKEWKLKVRTWALDVPDEVLEEFWEFFNKELEAVTEAKTKPRKKQAKAGGRKR